MIKLATMGGNKNSESPIIWRGRFALSYFCTLTLSVLFAGPALAQKVWIPTGDGNWFSTSKWMLSGQPNSGDIAEIKN
jgi:hypothetical protein